MNEPYMRRRHLPPSEPVTFSDPVPAGQTVVAAEMRRHAWNGVMVYGAADQDLLVHVEGGTEFGGSIIWSDRRTHRLKAGSSAPAISCWTASEWIRVSIENPGMVEAETVRVASYLSSVGTMPTIQKPLTTLWTAYMLPAGSGQHYTETVDLSGALGSRWFFRGQNGTPGPTMSASVAIQTSPDGVHWHDEKSLNSPGNLAGNNVISSHSMSSDHRYCRLRAGGNTGQPVTVWAWAINHYY